MPKGVGQLEVYQVMSLRGPKASYWRHGPVLNFLIYWLDALLSHWYRIIELAITVQVGRAMRSIENLSHVGANSGPEAGQL